VGTLTFAHADSPAGVHMTSELESTYKTGESTDTPLGSFLNRPVEIFVTPVALGNMLANTIDPWSSFMNDPLVKKRIEGFRHIRGHLRIRAVITGNPLLFGRFIMSYEPRATMSMHPKAADLSECRRMQLTQMPHIFLDPTTSEGGEMTLPFFCPENFMDLTNASSVSDMGRLYLHSMNQLRHANSSAGTCNIRIYAWMEDALICTPTAADFGAWTGQSEFSDSPVSSTASAVAKAASYASDIPMFAPYAKATEMVAKGVGGIAKMFGFSRPQIVTNSQIYKDRLMGELATTNTFDPVMRLGTDVKGELTIDPRTVGLTPCDEMSISSIVARESFIDKVDWTEAQNSGQVLMSLNVTPTYFETDSSVFPWRSMVTPSCACAILFQYWRGTLIYRFQIVASALHRGKLRITYDPVGPTATGALNEVYSRIIDLENTRDFEVPIAWHAREPFLVVENIAIGSTAFPKGTGTGLTCEPRYHNGQIRVEVLTPLTSPDPSLANSVSINMFQRGGPDVEFAVPVDRLAGDSITFRSSDNSVEPQSVMEVETDAQDNAPIGGAPIEPIGDQSIVISDATNLVFFGEVVPSLRTLLRRYTQVTRYASVISGLIPNRDDVSTARIPLVEYVMSMYVGWRGSIRHKINAQTSTTDSAYTVTGRAATVLTYINSCGLNGMAQDTRSLLFEVPYYHNKRFSHCRTNPNFAANKDTNPFEPNLGKTSWLGNLARTSDRFTAVGEDFTCFFFIGLPLLYRDL
jgi:hypothetical protein